MTTVLDDQTNYIVSGLERSGTSAMMRMLSMSGFPVEFDSSRQADEHNPKGYFELAGGKIINRLMDGSFDLSAHRGRVIKITAYGLKFLPKGNYKVVYMLRDIEEIMVSMQKMGAKIRADKDRLLFQKLNNYSLSLMENRDDIDHITVNYLDVVKNPKNEAERVGKFFEFEPDTENASRAIDPALYRNKGLKRKTAERANV